MKFLVLFSVEKQEKRVEMSPVNYTLQLKVKPPTSLEVPALTSTRTFSLCDLINKTFYGKLSQNYHQKLLFNKVSGKLYME